MVGHIVDINISTRLAAVHIEVDTFTILKIDEDWLPRIMDKVEGDQGFDCGNQMPSCPSNRANKLKTSFDQQLSR